jgi:hypothetical protein
VSVDAGSMELDFIAQSVSSISGWQPQVSLAYPVFTTASTVYWNPIMRYAISIGVNIMNAPYGEQPIYITSATSLGFNAALIESDGGACTAGELMMTSYSNIANNINWNGQNQQALSSAGNTPGQTKCFNVPNDHPTVDEVNSLRSVGGPFCTSYLDYTQPTSIAYEVSTLVTPSPICTTVPTTISTISTIYISPTYTVTSALTNTVAPTSYVYVSGTQSLADQYLKKRGLEIPVATTLGTATRGIPPKVTSPPAHAHHRHTHRAAKREATSPSFISTWDASKISLACSQVATGTSTSTYYTSTATSYSGSATVTVLSTVDVLGKITTVTEAQTVSILTGTTVTNTALATHTSTSATSCPLQTQTSCFTITGHGPSQIENTTLSIISGDNQPSFLNWPGWSTGIFYLTCEGYLVNLPSMMALMKGTWGLAGGWVTFEQFSYATAIEQIGTCTQDTVAGTLTCGGLWGVVPLTPSLGDNVQDAYFPGWTDEAEYFGLGILLAVTLSYNDVTCPCQY